jgi:flagellar protein FlaI
VEIVDIDPSTKEILTNEVFHWDPIKDEFYYSGKSYTLERIRGQHGLSKEEMMFELKRRIKVLEWMKNNNIRAFKDVARMIASYLERPDEIMIKISKKSEPLQKAPDIVEMEPMIVKQENDIRPGGSFEDIFHDNK